MGNLNSGRCYLITTVNTQVIIKVETDHYLRQVGWTFYVIDFFYFGVEYRGQIRGQNVGSLTSSKQFLGLREEPRGQK